MAVIKSETTWILERPPSCIEFVPNSPQHALIGTYVLENPREQEAASIDTSEKQTQTRTGSIVLIDIAENSL
jgi:diphthamide biosynthesis protein 7